jgi:hypothetical protein
MRVSLSYETLFVEKRERKEFETLADVRACILDSRELSISDCIAKRVFFFFLESVLFRNTILCTFEISAK